MTTYGTIKYSGIVESGTGVIKTPGSVVNGTLDLSTGSVFRLVPQANTTLQFSNSPEAYRFSVINVGNGTGTSISYDSVNVSVSEAQYPQGIVLSPDGTKMFIVDPNFLYQYTLSTPYDLSSRVYDSVSLDHRAQTNYARDLTIANNGSKLYIICDNTDRIHEYTLNTPYSLSSVTYVGSFSVSSQDGVPQGLAFSTDGTKMFMTGYNDRVYSYTLSTAFTVTTASYDGFFFAVNLQETAPTSMCFNSDGTEMYILGSISDNIHLYNLSTGFDVSTATYSGVSAYAQNGTPVGIWVSEPTAGPKKIYVVTFSAGVFQFTVNEYTPYTITYPGSVIWDGGTPPALPGEGETDVFEFVTSDGGTTFYGKQIGDNFS